MRIFIDTAPLHGLPRRLDQIDAGIVSAGPRGRQQSYANPATAVSGRHSVGNRRYARGRYAAQAVEWKEIAVARAVRSVSMKVASPQSVQIDDV